MKISLEGNQFAIFVKENLFNDDFEKTRFIINIQDQIKEYSNKPLLIPIPIKAAEPELPRVIMQNESKNKKIEIGVNKLIIYFDNQTETAENIPKSHIENAKKIYELLLPFKINRIGIINKYIITELTESSPTYLQQRIIKDGNLEDPKELNLSYNTVSNSSIENIKLNNLLAINANSVNSDIYLQTDINTQAEHREESNFSISDFEKIIDDAVKNNSVLVSNFTSKISFRI